VGSSRSTRPDRRLERLTRSPSDSVECDLADTPTTSGAGLNGALSLECDPRSVAATERTSHVVGRRVSPPSRLSCCRCGGTEAGTAKISSSLPQSITKQRKSYDGSTRRCYEIDDSHSPTGTDANIAKSTGGRTTDT